MPLVGSWVHFVILRHPRRAGEALQLPVQVSLRNPRQPAGQCFGGGATVVGISVSVSPPFASVLLTVRRLTRMGKGKNAAACRGGWCQVVRSIAMRYPAGLVLRDLRTAKARSATAVNNQPLTRMALS